VGKELSTYEWIGAFGILKELGVDFNLILGNEPWLLGKTLLDILGQNQVPYALYTTCPEPIFSKYKFLFFDSGILDNLSCGIDYPHDLKLSIDDDSYQKSLDAWKGLEWVKRFYPKVDTQGTITVHKKNIKYVPKLVKNLSNLGAFVGINFIHWNKDGQYDFFPGKEEIQDLLFSKKDYGIIKDVLNSIDSSNSLLHDREYILEPPEMLATMGWHCKGDPYGGPTIDSDGKLRVCGYRKGKRTPKFTIFDLPKYVDAWQEAVYQDAMECPGCSWSCSWTFHYWRKTDNEMGRNVFINHAGKHIDKSKWSKRVIE